MTKVPQIFITAVFGANYVYPNFQARYNIAPGQEAAVITKIQDKLIHSMKWGLVPFWAKDPAIGNNMINARAETIHEKPSFRKPFKSQRCLVLADGFFEWVAKDDGPKTPIHITLEDQTPFAFAGLWDQWQQPDDSTLETFTIITRDANAFMKPIHHRMPVILDPKESLAWLSSEDPKQLSNLLHLSAKSLKAVAVSTHVNSPRNDDLGCIRPANSS